MQVLPRDEVVQPGQPHRNQVAPPLHPARLDHGGVFRVRAQEADVVAGKQSDRQVLELQSYDPREGVAADRGYMSVDC